MAANPVVFLQGVRREVDLCVNILLAGGAAADNSNVIQADWLHGKPMIAEQYSELLRGTIKCSVN
jgi:hypothetical protein